MLNHSLVVGNWKSRERETGQEWEFAQKMHGQRQLRTHGYLLHK